MLCMQSTILCIACLPKDKRNKRYNPCVPSKNAKYPCWWPYQLVTLWKVVQTTCLWHKAIPTCPFLLTHTRTLIACEGSHPYAYCKRRKDCFAYCKRRNTPVRLLLGTCYAQAFTRSQVAYHARRFTILCIATWPCESLCILQTQSRALHARRFRVVGWLIVSQPTRTTQSLCCASFARKKVG